MRYLHLIEGLLGATNRRARLARAQHVVRIVWLEDSVPCGSAPGSVDLSVRGNKKADPKGSAFVAEIIGA